MNKRLVIGLSILLVLVLGVTGWLLSKEKKESPSSEEANALVKKPDLTDADIRNLYYNNYLISYILEGDVKTSEGFIKEDGKTYYSVDDELLKDIKNIDDIVNLIDNNVYDYYNVAINGRLTSGEYNSYKYVNDELYVLKKNVCNLIPNGIDKAKIYYDKEEDRVVVFYKQEGSGEGEEDDNEIMYSADKNMYLVNGLTYTCRFLDLGEEVK